MTMTNSLKVYWNTKTLLHYRAIHLCFAPIKTIINRWMKFYFPIDSSSKCESVMNLEIALIIIIRWGHAFNMRIVIDVNAFKWVPIKGVLLASASWILKTPLPTCSQRWAQLPSCGQFDGALQNILSQEIDWSSFLLSNFQVPPSFIKRCSERAPAFHQIIPGMNSLIFS